MFVIIKFDNWIWILFKIIELMVNSQTYMLFFVYLFDVTIVLWKRLSADGRTIKLPKRKGKKRVELGWQYEEM